MPEYAARGFQMRDLVSRSREFESADSCGDGYGTTLKHVIRSPQAEVGVIPLSATPPPGVGHDGWSGVCILVAPTK
jgi:hypothetical protein